MRQEVIAVILLKPAQVFHWSWVKFKGSFNCDEGIVGPTDGNQLVRVPVISGRIVGVKLSGSHELATDSL
jgi:hypothetical protein